jgi:putative chitinase
MQLSIEQLELCFPNSTDKLRGQFLSPINATLRKYEIDNRDRVSAFLAQVAWESGELRYVQEIATGSNYDNRSDLGNTKPEALEIARHHNTTPGRFWKGHGLIQITGYYNHLLVSQDLKIDAVNDPLILTKPLYAALCSGWFWDRYRCNPMADDRRFNLITRTVNGGLNHLEERKQYYLNNLKVLNG